MSVATTVNIILDGGKKYNKGKRSVERRKRNRRRRKNKTAKRRRLRQGRQDDIKTEYDTIHGLLLSLQHQLHVLDSTRRNLSIGNPELVPESTGLLTTIANQYTSTEGTCRALVGRKEHLQNDHLKQQGNSTMKPQKKRRHGSNDLDRTTLPLV
ncbi:hypothetical protein, partial, partial [Absidia glauca]